MDQPHHQLKIARIEMMWLVKLHLKIYPWMIMMIMDIKNITFHRVQMKKSAGFVYVGHVLHMNKTGIPWEDNNEAPCRRNSALRKEKYKRFWTMMFHRDAWKDPHYQAEKLRALRADPRHRKYEWHRRDIMPKCVLSLVRQWFPNPAGVPYMGHLWELYNIPIFYYLNVELLLFLFKLS